MQPEDMPPCILENFEKEQPLYYLLLTTTHYYLLRLTSIYYGLRLRATSYY